MAKLSDINYKKQLLLIGDSGTGKTGALASLARDGYRLFIIDLENGSKILRDLCPDHLDNIDVEQFADTYTIGPAGPTIKGMPGALMKASKQIDKWTKEVEWGPKDVLVLDSLTALGKAALAVAKAQNPRVGDLRYHIGNAQQLIEPYIDTLTSKSAPYNLIVITHIKYKELRDPKDQTKILEHKNFPSAIGEALPARLPAAFNDCFAVIKMGEGAAAKRQIVSSHNIISGLKTSAPSSMQKSYPLETGLSQIFANL